MCGIAGIINTSPVSFDYNTFCHLGIANDSRGGDSCGIFIDKEFEYGIGKEALFTNMFQNSKLLQKTLFSQIALLHCRKASVGAITVKQAQPVIISEDNEIKFVVIHNGTIHNYEELAQKYIPNVDIKGLTDSQVMTQIFYHKGFDALNEYNGGAVFVIVDYRNKEPKTYLFKGKSKDTKFGKKETEERPLWYSIDAASQELVFSSLWPHLMASRPYCNIVSLEPNKLFSFNGTELVVEKEYSREECCQTKSYCTPTYNEYGGFHATYIIANSDSLIYTYGGKRCNGRFIVDKYGAVEQVETKYTSTLWFFQGILMSGEKNYQTLQRMQKKSGLNDESFFKKYEKLIYLASKTRIFKKDGKYYKINSESEYELYNGILTLETSSVRYLIVDGVKSYKRLL